MTVSAKSGLQPENLASAFNTTPGTGDVFPTDIRATKGGGRLQFFLTPTVDTAVNIHMTLGAVSLVIAALEGATLTAGQGREFGIPTIPGATYNVRCVASQTAGVIAVAQEMIG